MPTITKLNVILWLSMSLTAFAQDAPPRDAVDPAVVVRSIANQYSGIRQFTFDGTMLFERKNAEDQRETLASWKVKVAIAPGGKYLLWAGNNDVLQYLVVSDGRTIWSYMPELNQYTKHEGGATDPGLEPDDVFAKGVPNGDHDVILCSRLVIPALAGLSRGAAFVEMNRSADVIYKGDERQLPILTVVGPKRENDDQIKIELVVEPSRYDVVRFEWSRSMLVSDEPRLAFLTVEFDKQKLGEPVPASYFSFNPPGDAKLVDDLPVPGLDGSPLVGNQAPDFELQLLDGTKVHLADLKGRPVVLAFWSNACASCRAELATLAALQQEFKDKRLAVLAISAEGKATAARYAGAADFPPLAMDDPAGRVHRLFRAHFAPTVVVLNSDAKVVRYLSGARDAAALRAALKVAGLDSESLKPKP